MNTDPSNSDNRGPTILDVEVQPGDKPRMPNHWNAWMLKGAILLAFLWLLKVILVAVLPYLFAAGAVAAIVYGWYWWRKS